jgi:uncharacterized membrane protein
VLARLAAEFCCFMGFQSISLEGDAQEVVHRCFGYMEAAVLLVVSFKMPRKS